jgi:hypothetical protein
MASYEPPDEARTGYPGTVKKDGTRLIASMEGRQQNGLKHLHQLGQFEEIQKAQDRSLINLLHFMRFLALKHP